MKKHITKVVSFVLLLLILLSLTACSRKIEKSDIAGEWKWSSHYNNVLKVQCFNTLLLKADGTFSEVVADPVMGTVYWEDEGTWYWDEEDMEVRLKSDGSSGTTVFKYDEKSNTLYQDDEIVYTKEGY